MSARSMFLNDCRLNYAVACAVAMLVLVEIVQVASGQIAIKKPTSKTESEIFNILIPAPREDSRPLSVAKRALEEEDFSEAFRELGRVLGINPDDPLKPIDADIEDFFVGPFDKPLTRKSLKLEAQKITGELSPKNQDF